MIATAWNNGKHSLTGAGYGLKLDEKDRDYFFDKDWTEVILELDGEDDAVLVNINKDPNLL
ncbi:hypothetical protein [Desulfitobacterium sp. AusDCA]|uniref:hypothetical protein n=1 Tax=Desulfitobacterium sp. AusDCA TaxID=3240383 RepID=UPI003DA7349B